TRVKLPRLARGPSCLSRNPALVPRGEHVAGRGLPLALRGSRDSSGGGSTGLARAVRSYARPAKTLSRRDASYKTWTGHAHGRSLHSFATTRRRWLVTSAGVSAWISNHRSPRTGRRLRACAAVRGGSNEPSMIRT